ncbi:MAG TPA: molybdenum ABC transporter ATP-binding protein [Pseudolabrys sp.]|nr:molybdenum ABC transporter ATP-binding protein [Pseudolabrys sp.]
MLAVNVKRTLPNFTLDVAFSGDGIIALFGPSGSGKTTIANVVAGLVQPDTGHIAIGDDVLFDSVRRIDVPAHKRRIGYVFQEGRLFPHMTVSRNLDYGRRMNGLPHNNSDRDRVIALLDLGSLLARRPGRLSGGERQRVAIGRALLSKPRLLVLDEPLASLDAARKGEILPYLERLQAETLPMIYVSHQPDEVKRIADQVVRIEHGKVAAAGSIDLLG